MPNKWIAVLFDIDGTLITSGGAGAESWKLAFNEVYGIPLDIRKFSDMGMTDPEVGLKAFEAALDRNPEESELEFIMERRLHYLRKTVAESTGYRVLEGAESLLMQLISDGHLLGLVSGNTEKAAHVKLQRANLNRFFAFGGYGSDSGERSELTKAALDKAEVVYGGPLDLAGCVAVGDTPRDVEAAHSAGIACIGVTSSKFSSDALLSAGADFVINSLAEGLPV